MGILLGRRLGSVRCPTVAHGHAVGASRTDSTGQGSGRGRASSGQRPRSDVQPLAKWPARKIAAFHSLWRPPAHTSLRDSAVPLHLPPAVRDAQRPGSLPALAEALNPTVVPQTTAGHLAPSRHRHDYRSGPRSSRRAARLPGQILTPNLRQGLPGRFLPLAPGICAAPKRRLRQVGLGHGRPAPRSSATWPKVIRPPFLIPQKQIMDAP